MSNISTWSTTAASNNSASPNGFPEGMLPSGVNNSAREMMAAVRSWYEDAEWRDFGHTVTYATTATFTIATDVTATYHAGRRIRCADASTLYGTISKSSYGAPNTTVTVTLDSGSLSASLTSVALGPSNQNRSTPTGDSVPVGTIIPWIAGYFANGSNGTYTRVLGTANTVAAANAYLNSSYWYVCDGAALNLAASPIFNAASRYLPNLTDDRFLMGDTTAGTAGGSNGTHTHTYTTVIAHTHTFSDSFTTSSNGVHTHTITGYFGVSGTGAARSDINDSGTTTTINDVASSGDHTHTGSVSGTTSSTGSASGTTSASSIDNKPSYLSCFYIIKVA